MYTHCEICMSELCEQDWRSNYAEHPHDGYWCGDCLTAYQMPQRKAILYLQQRLHPKSQIAVKACE